MSNRPAPNPVLLLSLLITASLTACGGGGSSSSTDTSSAATVEVALSADNAVPSARAAFAATGVGDGASSLGVGLTSSSGEQLMSAPVLRARALAAHILSQAQIQATATSTITCPGGGTAQVVANDANNNKAFDAGDSFSMSLSQCIDIGGTGSVANGSLTLTLDRYLSATGLSMTMSFVNFAAKDTSTGQTQTMNGNITVAVTGTIYDVSTSKLELSESTSSTTRRYEVRNFADRLIKTSASTTETLSGTLISAELNGGALTLSTPFPLVTLSSNSVPTQGSLLLKGAKGSALLIEPIGTTQVRLSVDANGDGVYETVLVKNASEFLS